MMKKLILILCILQGVLLSLRAQGEQQNIAYTDNNVRFTVISDGTLRLEYAPDGKFVDDKSFIAVDRLYPQVDYKLKTSCKGGIPLHLEAWNATERQSERYISHS